MRSPAVTPAIESVLPIKSGKVGRCWRRVRRHFVRERQAMLDIKSLEGTMISGLFRPLDGTLLQQVKLHRVEQYGIWIESQAVTEKLLSRAGVPSSQKQACSSCHGAK